jgi:8-oxo-dGTP pyrophosphatase MutT (NUDIX family)
VDGQLPKKASTLILIRPEGEGRFEVFLTRRPAEMRFLGGFFVFPGGTVRKGDWSEKTLQRCRGLSRTEAQRILGNELDPELSLGHCVAGIRELFEEVGILLCVTENGAEIDAEIQRELNGKRQALVGEVIDFGTLL